MITNEVLIKTENLSKAFGDLHVLTGIDAEIKRGEVIVVIGPSGSGKSTFLRCLNRLEEPTGGSIIFEGNDITDPKCDINLHRQRMGMVFQQFNLFPHLTVLRNLTIAPMKLLGKTKTEAEKRGMELLARVGLADKANAYPNQLSGGQQQRVAIARAIANNPNILLADEPTGALDQKTGAQVMELFHELNDEGRTIIMITHDAKIASHAKRIVRILDGNIGEGALEDA